MTTNQILEKYWGYEAFRPLQEEIVQSVLERKDTLALLPTGGGKSICFQVPAMVMDGICIVISPLIALMKDQVENLNKRGINAVAIYAGMGKREIDILLENCVYGPIKFLYLSPERLLSSFVRTRISYMNVCLFAVDEAHCISQWGYDFRPPYLQISELRNIHPEAPIIALTATATPQVRIDIIDKLALKNPTIFVKSFARKNLTYVVYDIEDKYKKLLDITQKVSGCGLVYVRNRRSTNEVAQFLLRNGISSDFYHAGLENTERFAKQEDWKKDKIRVMVATNAFGMGIDKPDVRFVVHLDLPESLEAYYQEAGRAGRDEKKAYTVLLANKNDTEFLNLKYGERFPSLDEIKHIYQCLGNYYQLAYGAGDGLMLEFDIVDFCKRFLLTVNKVLMAFKFLERDGYLAFSENIYLPSRLMFIAKSEEVYRFQIENKLYDLIIKTIQRSYGGAFDNFVKINEADLCTRLRMPYAQLVAYLKKLDEHQIISYLPQTNKPQLTFVQARVDSQHLGIDAAFIRLRKEIILNQIKSVIAYAETETCRSIQLLHYFGEEKAEKCGVCDVCISEKRKLDKADYFGKIEYEIISCLQSANYDLDSLMKHLKTGSDKDKLAQLRLLLDAGEIKFNGHKYHI